MKGGKEKAEGEWRKEGTDMGLKKGKGKGEEGKGG